MVNLSTEFAKAFGAGLTAHTLTSCSRWAASRRIMGGDYPGPYSFKYHPWTRALHDTWASFNYVLKAAQVGITEVAINRALYTIDTLKRDVLYVLPTTLNAGDFSKGRFAPALANSPYLKTIFTDTDAINLKRAGANCLYIRGSRGKSNLRSIPVAELILDEVDIMNQEQIRMALTRLHGQEQKHVLGLSTPSVPGRGIHELYATTTQEHFMFKCPGCGKTTELIWPDCVEIVGEFATDVRVAESFLKCKECGVRLEHKAKPEFLADGHWEPTVQANPDVRGFYINQLYSTKRTPGELVSDYLAGFGNECAAKEFHNSCLGLAFIGDGAKVSEAMIDKTIRDHTMADLRPTRGGQLITMGVDQGKVCHYVICEWLLTSKPGRDLSAAAMCKVLSVGKFMEEEWSRLDELMSEWQVLYAVLDADPQINEGRRFCRKYAGYASLTRYRKGQAGKEVSVSDEETGAPMATVDRTSWISAALGRFKADPVRIWLPRDIPQEFRNHICSPVRTYQRDEHGSSYATIVETGPDHYAQALTYAEIALHFAPYSTSQNISKAP